MSQLVLPIQMEVEASFDNYLDAGNAPIVSWLKEALIGFPPERGQVIVLWGPKGVGKSHLLNAFCQAARVGGLTCYQDPIDTLPSSAAKGVIAIDDADRFAGDQQAEQSLLAWFEAVRQLRGVLLLTTLRPPSAMGIKLPDLVSRLNMSQVFELVLLDDNGKAQALAQRAAMRGFELSPKVISWLMTHETREISSLFEILNRLDAASLKEKRKVTIPLLRELLK